jgi:hypothetical protein
MNKDPARPVIGPVRLAPRTLHRACRHMGHDRDGTRCPGCAIRSLCESDERWLVNFSSRDLELD